MQYLSLRPVTRVTLVRMNRRPEADDVAVGIDHESLTLAPFRVLGGSDVRPGIGPGPGQFVSVLDEQVSRAGCGGCPVRDGSEVDLDPPPGREAVATVLVGTGAKAEPAVVLERDRDVAH